MPKSSEYINKGQELIEKGLKSKNPCHAAQYFYQAIAQFDAAISTHESDDLEDTLNLRANYYKARLYEKLHLFNDALESYNKVLDKSYLLEPKYFLEPLDEVLSHQLQWVVIPEKDTKVIDVHIRKAVIYYRLNMLEQLDQELAPILSHDPKHFYANIYLALMRVKANDLDNAEFYFSQIQTELNLIKEHLQNLAGEINKENFLQDCRKLSLCYLYIGYRYYYQQNLKQAERHFKRAIEFWCNNQEAKESLAKSQQPSSYQSISTNQEEPPISKPSL